MRERCDSDEFAATGREFVAEPRNSPGGDGEASPASPAGRVRARRPALRHRRQRRDLLRPRRHRAQPGLDHGDGDRQPRHGDRQHRPPRRRREPAARPEQRAGLLRHGLVPARALRLPPHLRRRDARACSRRCGACRSTPSRACASPTCSTPPSTARFKGLYIQGEDIAAVRPQHPARRRRPRGDGMRRRAGPVPERDRELRPCLPAGLVLPREGRHLHQCRAPHPARAQGDGADARLWPTGRSRMLLANALGYADALRASVARSWTRSRG